ncbi:hypothetical protein [Herbaspirillum sp. RV1423]|uniref:hypothetical protein n=1 Tax=Herbaspirillum sp. RV1423 TaxID=1443993 RepID=UPI0012DE317D|nr:hypothetical protein [Herbaspirillum sp. RV1423]
MKSLDRFSMRKHAAALVGAASVSLPVLVAAAVAAALCSIDFPPSIRLAVPFAQAGTAVFAAAALIAAGRLQHGNASRRHTQHRTQI